MTLPALMALEMGRPLNFVASQAIHFFKPIVSVILDGPTLEEFANFLEQRGSVEYLCQRLEHWERIGPDVEDTETQPLPDGSQDPHSHDQHRP